MSSSELQRPIEPLRPAPAREQPLGAGPGGSGGIDHGGGSVWVASGVYSEQLPVAGLRVSQVRERFADHMDIHPQAIALIDGRNAPPGHVLRPGEVLTFVHPSGEKGGGR